MVSKVCNRCGAEKPQIDYYAGDNSCKVCRCALVRQRRATNPAVQEYDRKRGNRQSLAYMQGYRAKNPAKYKATTAVNNAVRDGRLFKPDTCQECLSDLHVEGHHDDYSKPLEVRWLCSRCHSLWHAAHPEMED